MEPHLDQPRRRKLRPEPQRPSPQRPSLQRLSLPPVAAGRPCIHSNTAYTATALSSPRFSLPFRHLPLYFHRLSTTFPPPFPLRPCCCVCKALQGNRPGRPLRACYFGDGPLPCCLVRPRTTPGRRPAGSDRRGPTAVPARLARARLARAGRPGRCRRGGSGGRVSRRPPPPPLTRFDCVLIPTHFSSSDSYSDTLFIVRLFPKGGGMTGSWA